MLGLSSVQLHGWLIALLATASSQLQLTSKDRTSTERIKSIYFHPHEAFHIALDSSHLREQLSRKQEFLKEDWVAAIFPQRLLSQRSNDLSLICGNQTRYMLDSLPKEWALSMIDAWAKPESGFLTGDINWIGNYEECISVKSYNGSRASVMSFEGKYCTAQIPFDAKPGVPAVFQIGVCVPDGCVEEDVAVTFNVVIDTFSPNSTAAASAICQPKTKPLSAGAKGTIALFVVMAVLCAIGTLYDMYSKIFLRQQSEHCLQKLSTDSNHLAETTEENGESRHSKLDERTPLLNSSIQISERSTRIQGGICKLLLCFSVYTNGCKILSASQPAGSLKCIHGIRFLSMSWVILGHTLVFSLQAMRNIATVFTWFERFTFQAILSATVSVDSFFVLSGLLGSYLSLKEFSKLDTSLVQFFKSVPVLYLHRYLRLTPTLGCMVLFYSHITYFMGSGPLYPVDEISDLNCKNNSWATLLYINNLYDPAHECAAWTWYLANDFQFFLISPFIIYTLYRLPKIGLVVASALIFGSCVCATLISLHYKFGMGFYQGNPDIREAIMGKLFTAYYAAPWVRYQSFGVGILAGFVLWKCDGSLNMPKWANIVFWVLSAGLCLSVLYAPFGTSTFGVDKHVPSDGENAVYNGWSRTAWSVGLSYVIIACCTGNGGWVNTLLSWSALVPLSRLTYCAYLVHPVVMTYVTFSHQNLTMYTTTTYVYMFLAYMVLSYGVAFIFSLLIEAPFLNLDKHYITGRLSARHSKKSE